MCINRIFLFLLELFAAGVPVNKVRHRRFFLKELWRMCHLPVALCGDAEGVCGTVAGNGRYVWATLAANVADMKA